MIDDLPIRELRTMQCVLSAVSLPKNVVWKTFFFLSNLDSIEELDDHSDFLTCKKFLIRMRSSPYDRIYWKSLVDLFWNIIQMTDSGG